MADKIFVTSDLHFNHDKEFVYKPRGFNTVEEMNTAIINNWNSIIDNEDDIYVLGDLMLGDNEKGLECIKQLNGRLHIILGNHDTAVREQIYTEQCDNVIEVKYATIIKYRKYHFYLSHYPTMTANFDSDSLHNCLINLYGHTHQKTNFYNEMPFIYHIGLDSHNNTPVLLDDAIEDMKKKVEECKTFL